MLVNPVTMAHITLQSILAIEKHSGFPISLRTTRCNVRFYCTLGMFTKICEREADRVGERDEDRVKKELIEKREWGEEKGERREGDTQTKNGRQREWKGRHRGWGRRWGTATHVWRHTVAAECLYYHHYQSLTPCPAISHSIVQLTLYGTHSEPDSIDEGFIAHYLLILLFKSQSGRDKDLTKKGRER